jgi:hypothetical protein
MADIRLPPEFCQYAGGACDQDFTVAPRSRGVFLYPSEPETIASTIETAVWQLRDIDKATSWLTWREFKTGGQVIFCAICRALRFSDMILADVTTLNFNLMFEIGVALSLGVPLGLLRDTSYQTDHRAFKELSILENIGYIDFQNSAELVHALRAAFPLSAVPTPPVELNRDSPIYVVKSHISTEGQLRLVSLVKRSPLRFRAYDPAEDPPLSLQEARRQVASSFGVVGHLLDPARAGGQVHNARTALIAGLATGAGKTVVLFQEGNSTQPIDYRDLVIPYTNANQLEPRLEPFIRQTLQHRLDTSVVAARPPRGLLEKLDLGDVAAENEIGQLKTYFVATGQFNEARRGHARLVVGRKGAGKTAIFYGIRDSLPKTPGYLVLDLKPEGHQFTKLRETVLAHLTPGLEEHTLTAFWQYILMCEISQKVIDSDYSWAQRDPGRSTAFDALKRVYKILMPDDTGDLSERLLRQVDRLASQIDVKNPQNAGAVTQAMFSQDIPAIEAAVGAYLDSKKEVWLLIDNLDKGWPTRGAKVEDVLIIRTLLEAARKLQRQLEQRQLKFVCLAFLRNDIYDLLVRQTPDRDKDTAIAIDWDDAEGFKEVVRQRIMAGASIDGSFDEVWSAVFDQRVGTQDAFRYVIERTLLRPRDVLRFLRRAVEVAVNRRHERVHSDDFLTAESTYSEELLLSINYEVSDVAPEYVDLLYDFIGCDELMSRPEVLSRLSSAVGAEKADEALQLLVWFGFLGIKAPGDDEAQYSFQVRYNLNKLLSLLRKDDAQVVIHPAFRSALGTERTSRLPL